VYVQCASVFREGLRACVNVCVFVCACVCSLVSMCVPLLFSKACVLVTPSSGRAPDACVSVVLQWCYSGVIVVSKWCRSGVTVVLQ
jgi:hypothetical protein